MPDHLTAAARARATKSLAAVKASVRRLAANGKSISVSAVSRDAGVSRNYIYSHSEARELVVTARSDQTRQRPNHLPTPPRPGSSDASLRTRLAAALQSIETLESQLVDEREKNSALIAEVMQLQNPELPENVRALRPRRF